MITILYQLIAGVEEFATLVCGDKIVATSKPAKRGIKISFRIGSEV